LTTGGPIEPTHAAVAEAPQRDIHHHTPRQIELHLVQVGARRASSPLRVDVASAALEIKAATLLLKDVADRCQCAGASCQREGDGVAERPPRVDRARLGHAHGCLALVVHGGRAAVVVAHRVEARPVIRSVADVRRALRREGVGLQHVHLRAVVASATGGARVQRWLPGIRAAVVAATRVRHGAGADVVARHADKVQRGVAGAADVGEIDRVRQRVAEQHPLVVAGRLAHAGRGGGAELQPTTARQRELAAAVANADEPLLPRVADQVQRRAARRGGASDRQLAEGRGARAAEASEEDEQQQQQQQNAIAADHEQRSGLLLRRRRRGFKPASTAPLPSTRPFDVV
jgi:hypothetical protein